MKGTLILLALAAYCQAALPSDYIFNHRNQPNPAFRKAFFKSQPSAPTTSHPYHALISVDEGGACSGILVDVDKVLTSAQCVDSATEFEIHFGRQYLYDEPLNDALTVVNATRVVIHPNFEVTFRNAVNDLALILLDAPVEGRTPVALEKKSASFPLDQYLSVKGIGYGQTDASEVYDGRSMQPFLSESGLVTLGYKQCRGILGSAFAGSDLHLCVFAPAISSCYGDPGSPLVVNYASDNFFTLVGVTSFGSKDFCETGAPIVFTNVRNFLPWLEENGVPVQP